ncbi:MAG: hypothetical protein KME27_05080 [Lyngbya sp. HA4199-MV5]|nr:hypothetical protein [Lyngbya sp. HA4199-MV5]
MMTNFEADWQTVIYLIFWRDVYSSFRLSKVQVFEFKADGRRQEAGGRRKTIAFFTSALCLCVPVLNSTKNRYILMTSTAYQVFRMATPNQSGVCACKTAVSACCRMITLIH